MNTDNKKYEEFMLPFKLVQDEEENENWIITIRAFGQFYGQFKIFEAVYAVNDPKCTEEKYAEMINLLKDNKGRKIKVLCKIKDQKIKKFKIDLSSLALIYNKEIFNKLELLGFAIDDKINTENTINTN